MHSGSYRRASFIPGSFVLNRTLAFSSAYSRVLLIAWGQEPVTFLWQREDLKSDKGSSKLHSYVLKRRVLPLSPFWCKVSNLSGWGQADTGPRESELLVNHLTTLQLAMAPASADQSRPLWLPWNLPNMRKQGKFKYQQWFNMNCDNIRQ